MFTCWHSSENARSSQMRSKDLPQSWPGSMGVIGDGFRKTEELRADLQAGVPCRMNRVRLSLRATLRTSSKPLSSVMALRPITHPRATNMAEKLYLSPGCDWAPIYALSGVLGDRLGPTLDSV